MTKLKRYLTLNLDYRKIGGVHFVWLGPVCFSFCKRKARPRSGDKGAWS